MVFCTVFTLLLVASSAFAGKINDGDKDCGKVTSDGIGDAQYKTVPWHALVYSRSNRPYKFLCGGTLVSKKVVISAAHCFWSDSVDGIPWARKYAVALGKQYLAWSDPNDKEVQFSNVTTFHIPETFRGLPTNYQSDIAVLELDTEVVYNAFVKPACLDFDITFSEAQLRRGEFGKVVGLSPNPEAKKIDPKSIKVFELPYLTYQECFVEVPIDFQSFLTSDKFCAGLTNGTSICQGFGGSGLAFPTSGSGVQRFYLRGIASAAAASHSADYCGISPPVAFTDVVLHERFIKQYLHVN